MFIICRNIKETKNFGVYEEIITEAETKLAGKIYLAKASFDDRRLPRTIRISVEKA